MPPRSSGKPRSRQVDFVQSSVCSAHQATNSIILFSVRIFWCAGGSKSRRPSGKARVLSGLVQLCRNDVAWTM